MSNQAIDYCPFLYLSIACRTAKAFEMSLIEYQTAYSGIKTHSILKKTRYTHIYMKLLPSRLMLPVSHSGQKVMKPMGLISTVS